MFLTKPVTFRDVLVLLLVTVVLPCTWFYFVYLKPSEANSVPQEPQKTELNTETMWNVIQNWREKSGYITYQKNDQLCEFANSRISDLENDPQKTHHGLHDRFSTLPYVISENIVSGYISEGAAFDSWLRSASHAAALKAPYRYSCVACKNLDCVQLFSNL